MHLVSDRARLATSKCDLTKWVNMPPKTGQRLFDDCGQGTVVGEGLQRTTHVGLTIGEISSKTIKN